MRTRSYQEYNPDSAGTRRDECLVGDSHRQVLVDGDKVLKWFKSKLRSFRSEPVRERTRLFDSEIVLRLTRVEANVDLKD